MSVCPFKPPRPPHRGPGVPAAPRAPGPVGAAGGGPPPAAAAGDEHPDQHGAAAEAGGAAAEGPPRRHHQHQLPAARLRYYITYLLPPSGHSLHHLPAAPLRSLTTFRAFCPHLHPKRLTIQSHIHTPTAESTTQGDSQLLRSSQGEVSPSGTPRHSDRRSRGSNQQPSCDQSNRSTS